MGEEDLLTSDEAREYLGVSRGTFFNFVREQKIPRYRKALGGKTVYYKRSELDAARGRIIPIDEDAPGQLVAAGAA